MNQNEASNIELNKNESINDELNKLNKSNENSTALSQKLTEAQNETHFISTALEENVLESQQNKIPSTSKCKSNTLDDAMPYAKEMDDNTKNITASKELDSSIETKDFNITSIAEILNEEEEQKQCSQRTSVLSSNKDDITSEIALTTIPITTLITACTATTETIVASPLTAKLEVAEPTAKPADIRQLHYAASAPILSCVPLRANQQQQQKIKCYHDAKQTALWDTKSSTSSGGAILKSGIYGSPKMLRKVTELASCLPRRVSFPKSDKELVTGYLEPANPWEHVSTVKSVSEIADLYIKSCHKHNTRPLPDIIDQLKAVELNKLARQPILSLKKVKLQAGDCEALEEILKRVQYKCIDLSSCELEENAISALCEIIEYYEAANELNISTNPKGMTHRGWISCAYMVGRSQELHVLNAEGNPISKSSAEHLGNALSTSHLHTVKLEHCGLKGAPLSGLCMKLRHNKILKELWLAHNDLDFRDAESIAELLKANHFLELVDISNNNIGDNGLKYIVEALIVQSKELERRSMFQRAAAIEDDIFSSVDGTINEPETIEEKSIDNFGNKKSNGITEKSDNDNINSIVPVTGTANSNVNPNTMTVPTDEDESSKKNNLTELLIPDLVALNVQNENVISHDLATLSIEETEGEDDTEDTVKSNTIKSKQHQHQHQHQSSSVVGGGQSMLDKLLSMNSDSSSEEVSNLSTDTIAASDDTSFVSDDIFDVASVATIKTNTCANTKASNLATLETATAIVATATLPLSLNNEGNILSFGSSVHNQNNCEQKNVGRGICKDKNIYCDTCTLEANNHCINCNGDKKNECHKNNYNNNNNNNTNINSINNNSNLVQNQSNNITDSTHKEEIINERPQPSINAEINASVVAGSEVGGVASVFEVRAEESDCMVPCSTSNKSNVLLLQQPTSAVDVNKNTRIVEDYDDTHSTDSAFESASEGDISRTLPEEFTRLSTSLESTRLDITKDLAIETATIASESIEYLSEVGTLPVASLTTNMLPLVKIGKQKSDEVKTKSNEVHFNETAIMMETIEASQNKTKNDSSAREESSIPKVNIETDSSSCIEVCEERTNNPITTPPPPSTSPGGISLNMRRTDSSCNFMTQSTRNHSQSSDSLCSDNSLDGSVSSELNLSTSNSASQLNEKLTKNDTLTRQQQRQCDTTTESSSRAPGGLKALAVWNNNLTKEAGLYISDLLADTTSLELLNIGKNCLSNDFVLSVKDRLTRNTTLTTLGLQSAHLSAKGIESLASILAFGGNSTLQRIDIRDNKLEVESLTTLADALKSNTTVTQIDIDDEPKRLSVGSDAHLDYARVVENLRSMCSRNEKTQAQLLAEKAAANSNKRRVGYYVGSRKISLTCHSRPLIEYSVAPAVTMPSVSVNNKLEVKRKTGVRLRSPVPSPPTMSPSSSPNRQSRFQVFRVNEVSPLTSPATNSAPIPTLSYSEDPTSSSTSSSSSLLTTSTSLPSMATVTSTTQTVRRQFASSPRSRFHVSKIYEDPKVPLAKRSLPPITPPIHLPPTPMSKSAPKNDNIQLNESLDQREIETELCNISSDTIDHNPSVKAQLIRCPIAVFNENDITLTHNATNNDNKLSTFASNEAAENRTKVDEPPSDINTVGNTTSQQVARSWIGIANPTAVDKLLTLFQNPATIFQRCSSPEHKNVSSNASVAENTNSTSQVIQTINQTQNSTVPANKQSPPIWPKLGTDTLNPSSSFDSEKILPNEQPKTFLGAASKQLRDFGKQVFRQNVVSACESINSSTDNLLSLIPTASVECNDDRSKFNMKFIELKPTDITTTTTTTATSLTTTKESDNRRQNSIKTNEDKTDLTVAARLDDINASASGTQE